MDDKPQQSLLVSLDRACQLLGGISRAKLYLLLKAGELESRKIGTRRFVTRRSVERVAFGDENNQLGAA